MASVTRYHDYLWSFAVPWLGSRVLEVGVGFGQYTRRMLDEQRQVLGCDIDPSHLEDLRASTASALLETERLDLENPEPFRGKGAAFSPDTIVLLNVLEHILAHEAALAFLREIAAPGGRIVLIVPAHEALRNGLDRDAGHHRRYSRTSLVQALRAAQWEVLESRYINLPGVAGWLAAGWLNSAGRSRTELDSASTNWLLRTYDRFFVGLSRVTDSFASAFAGLSVFAVARKR